MLSNSQYKSMSNAIRQLTIDATFEAKSGHPGMPMGMADFTTILYSEFLKFNPSDDKWPNRDRVILSAGHGSMLLYSLLYLTGYEDITLEDIKNFRKLHSKTAGHPEYGILDGIETTTGPLGQGLANAVGMAVAAKKMQAKFGPEIINHKIYVICGDGCLMEGISQEAISIAGHLNLDNLILVFDNNLISIDGKTSLTTSDDQAKRFEACNWDSIEINGHDHDQIRAALFRAGKSNKPFFISCKTIIGYGSPNFHGSEKCHGSPFSSNEVELTKRNLNLPIEKFVVPDEIIELWRTRSARCKKQYDEWQILEKKGFLEFLKNPLPKDIEDHFSLLKEQVANFKEDEATRSSSGKVISFLSKKIDSFVGGSADLTESNNTNPSGFDIFNKDNYQGSYIHYGIREHAMVSVMNGISLYGGFIPYGGTFLVFSDYARPAIRLAAIMKQKIILVMTHDSIGVGEDGPTHQPVEHLASLRAMPGINVLRPADHLEVIECWNIALKANRPSILSLTRQKLPQLSRDNLDHLQKGAYIIKEAEGAMKVTIFATGSEVSIALEGASILANSDIPTRVVSVYCWEKFFEQSKEYQNKILANDSIKVAIEAGSSFGWERFIGRDGIFIGINEFGASAPGNDLYEHFKITSKELVKRVKSMISMNKK